MWKRAVVLMIILLISGSAIWFIAFAPKKTAVSVSPDGKYRLIVYKVPMLCAMPGQGSDHMAVVELRDRYGRLCARLSDREPDAVMLRDIDPSKIVWTKNDVTFAVARMFRLP
ncbi:MAG: hypothetical protein AB2L14_21485 [Candidatus Xenobiia bacterium LiM19]